MQTDKPIPATKKTVSQCITQESYELMHHAAVLQPVCLVANDCFYILQLE